MARPISPFLSVYKPQITSMFSIAERITGIILVLVIYFGIILIKLENILITKYWFYSICYWVIKSSVSNIIIGSLLLFTVFCFVYHLIFGLRYIYWDRVYGELNLEELKKTTPILLLITVGVSLLYWLW